MKRALLHAMVVCIMGCAAPFSRLLPTESDYKQRFLRHLRPKEISSFQFTYHGAVGGEASIARFKVGEDAVSQLRAKAQREEIYSTDAAQDLKRKLGTCTRERRVPEWFDFPFDRSLPVFIDSGDFTVDHPAYLHEWYVDEDRGLVYFIMIQG